jgi:predicted nucleotidyltransferase
MEVEIKRAVKAGNSSAVILPRAWLSKEVRVELIKKTLDRILLDTIEIIKKYIESKEIIGIYLVGSYAREEENESSDIDILIVSENFDKGIIKEGIYSILIVSKKLLEQKLKNDLFPIGQMLKEAKTLINESYLKELNIKVTKKNIIWYIKTTKEKLNLIKKILKKEKKRINNRITYTLILRIRTIHIIQKLIKNQDYSSKEFIKLIAKISGSNNAYQSYLAVKNETKKDDITGKEEAEKLYYYLEKQLEDVKRAVQ